MNNDLFQEGGPLNIKKVAPEKYELAISIPIDSDGYIGRECIDENCSPGYFKIKLGTGLTDHQEIAYCPYCRKSDSPSSFITANQKNYILAKVQNEATDGINKVVKEVFGLDSTVSKEYGQGLFPISIKIKPVEKQQIPILIQEDIRRDVICPFCGLDHTVYGLAFWCADCGKDIFITHVEKEFLVIEIMLSAIDKRREGLGIRVASRDMDNSLEDIVSIYEAVLKIIFRKYLLQLGKEPSEVDELIFNVIRNQFQNIQSSQSLFLKYANLDILDALSDLDRKFILESFEKRHPITHNLGIIDRKYMFRVQSNEFEGREIQLTLVDLLQTEKLAKQILISLYQKLFINS